MPPEVKENLRALLHGDDASMYGSWSAQRLQSELIGLGLVREPYIRFVGLAYERTGARYERTRQDLLARLQHHLQEYPGGWPLVVVGPDRCTEAQLATYADRARRAGPRLDRAIQRRRGAVPNQRVFEEVLAPDDDREAALAKMRARHAADKARAAEELAALAAEGAASTVWPEGRAWPAPAWQPPPMKCRADARVLESRKYRRKPEPCASGGPEERGIFLKIKNEINKILKTKIK